MNGELKNSMHISQDVQTLIQEYEQILKYNRGMRHSSPSGTTEEPSSWKKECFDLAISAVPFLKVAWKLLDNHFLNQENNQRTSFVEKENTADVFRSLHEFFFNSNDAKITKLATILALTQPNPFFRVVMAPSGECICETTAIRTEELNEKMQNGIEEWYSAFKAASKDSVRSRTTQPLDNFLGGPFFESLLQCLRTVGSAWDMSLGRDEETNGTNFNSRGFLLSRAIVQFATGEALRPSTALDVLVKLNIYHLHLNVPFAEKVGTLFRFSPEHIERAERLVSYARENADTSSRRHYAGTSFAIDSADTAEVDDSISMGDEDGEVVVHIADVARIFNLAGYIDPIFEEALNRQTTIYLPEGKHFMLPPAIVAETSLGREEGDIPAISVKFKFQLHESQRRTIDRNSISIQRSIIKAPVRLTYETADDILKDPAHRYHDMMDKLFVLAKGFRGVESKSNLSQTRANFTVADVEKDEPQISVEMRRTTTYSEVLVSQLMIAANAVMAAFGEMHGISLPYRKSNGAGDIVLSTNPGIHEKMNLSCYTQATSPIRRCGDLVAQLQISDHLQGIQRTDEYIPMARISLNSNRKARQFSRRSEKYWFMEYIRRLGYQVVHRGLAIGCTPSGTKIILQDYGIHITGCPSLGLVRGEVVGIRFTNVNPRTGKMCFDVCREGL